MIDSTYQSTKLDCYSEFFTNFTFNSIFHAFTGFDFPAWESPMVRLWVSSSLNEKYLRLFYDRRSAA